MKTTNKRRFKYLKKKKIWWLCLTLLLLFTIYIGRYYYLVTIPIYKKKYCFEKFGFGSVKRTKHNIWKTIIKIIGIGKIIQA